MHYDVGNQVPLRERVCLREITDSSRAVADGGCRLDDRLEDRLTGLLNEILIGHAGRRYVPRPANSTAAKPANSTAAKPANSTAAKPASGWP
jgi:hypothetical protein